MRVREEKAKKDDYQKALSAYGEAMKEFRKGKFSKASELLKTFIEKYSSERELVDRARIYLAVSEEQEKEKKETVQLKTFDDYFQYSVYKMNSGEYEEALKLLEKALKMNPQEGKVYYLLAQTYCLMGQPEASLDNLKKAIQLDKFFRILVQNETDFKLLWEDKKFKLITRMT